MTDPLLEPNDYTGQTLPIDEEIKEDYSTKAYEQALSEAMYNQQLAYEQSKNEPIEPAGIIVLFVGLMALLWWSIQKWLNDE